MQKTAAKINKSKIYPKIADKFNVMYLLRFFIDAS